LPLISAAADKACEALGSGAIAPGVAALSFGTTATVSTTHRRYVEPIPFVPPYPAAIPGWFSLEVQVPRGYWLVEWFKREFGCMGQQVANGRAGRPRLPRRGRSGGPRPRARRRGRRRAS